MRKHYYMTTKATTQVQIGGLRWLGAGVGWLVKCKRVTNLIMRYTVLGSNSRQT